MSTSRRLMMTLCACSVVGAGIWSCQRPSSWRDDAGTDAGDDADPDLEARDGDVSTEGGLDSSQHSHDSSQDVLDEPEDEPDAEVAEGDCVVIGEWSATGAFVEEGFTSHPLPSFASGSYYYVHTHDDGDDRRLFSARQNPDGSLGPWQLASPDHGGGPHGFTAIDVVGEPFHFRNGHIARYTMSAEGLMIGDVECIESSVDTAFSGNRYVWDTAVLAQLEGGGRWVFHLGGFSFDGYAYRQDLFRSPVPLQSSFDDTGRDHPAERPGKAVFIDGPGSGDGFLFSGESGGGRLWRCPVGDDGSLGDWTELASLPPGTGNERGDLFAVDRTLFTVRGSRVYGALMEAGGSLAPWVEMPSLPEDQIDITWGDGHLEGASYGVMGSHVYLTGPRRVFYAELRRGQPCTE